jgi:hypothetical protein
MILITPEFKAAIVTKLHELRANFDGTDGQYARQYGINPSVYSTIKTATNLDGLLKNAQWLNIGRELDVTVDHRKWNMAKTDVFQIIAEDIAHCKSYSKSMMFVDDTEIGKTYAAKYLARTLKNCFYVDASQSKTKNLFIRALARVIGVDDTDKIARIKANIKYALKLLPNPVVIIDEAGDLEYTAFLDIKEFWNGTDRYCGWYLIGADGMRAKIERGIGNKKVGYAEIFSRFGKRYSRAVPADKNERRAFYKKLVSDVLDVNMKDKSMKAEIVKRCLANDHGDGIGGLRRAEDLLILNEN